MNGNLIARRRVSLGLSRQELADATGLRWNAITTLEQHGEPLELSLAAARTLAATLGLTLDQLATARQRAADPGDDVKLEALLAETRRPLSAEQIARTLDWDLTRAATALASLAERLADTGQELRAGPRAAYSLAARHEALTDLEIGRAARTAPTTTAEAHLLLKLLVHRRADTYWESFHANERPTLTRLVNQGLLVDSGERLWPSDTLAFNLQPQLSRRRLDGRWPAQASADWRD